MNVTKNSRAIARTGLLLAVAGATSVGLAGGASAEGRWDSTIGGPNPTDGWLIGRSTQTWHDNDTDNVETSFGMSECHDSWNRQLTSVTFQLTRDRAWWQPDENRGLRDYSCGNPGPGTKLWGDQPAGDYWFTHTHQNHQEGLGWRLQAKNVTTKY